MAKGYQTHKERLEAINALGKAVGKRASFKCEWCESKDDLRIWDHAPDDDPEMDTVALLCQRCRDLADGGKADQNELRTLRNALWSDVPAVSDGAAEVLLRSREPWVREAIEESIFDEERKARLLG